MNIGSVVNARTLDGAYVQGRLIYRGRRGYGPRPNLLVAILLGMHSYAGCVFVCTESSIRRPPRFVSTIRVAS